MSKIGIIGAGAFGTALACVFTNANHSVTLWGRNEATINNIRNTRKNTQYLPNISLPNTLTVTANFKDLQSVDALLIVVPAQELRSFLIEHDFTKITCPLILCAKGIEASSGLLQSQIGAKILPQHDFSVITGPGFATEIAHGKPTALTLANTHIENGKTLQKMLSTPSLRLYLSTDINGVQLGGALKNILAIACGIVAGANLGQSAQAALMTRGFAEITRLAIAMGARPETLSGLAGFGDMVLTCTSLQSRNFSFGCKLAQNGVFSTGKTYEGVATAKACLKLAKHHKITMPIAQTVGKILAGDLDVKTAIVELMSRPLRNEH